MPIINLTPHAINLKTKDGYEETFEPSGQIARLETNRRVAFIILMNEDGCVAPVNKTEFGAVTGLPDYQPATFYIVSALVA